MARIPFSLGPALVVLACRPAPPIVHEPVVDEPVREHVQAVEDPYRPPAIVVEDLPSPPFLAVGEGTLVFSHMNGTFARAVEGGEILKLADVGTDCHLLVVKGAAYHCDLAIGSDLPPQFYRTPLGGGPSTRLVKTAREPRGVAFAGDAMILADFETVFVHEPERRVLADLKRNIGRLVADENHVWFQELSSRTIFCTAPEGGQLRWIADKAGFTAALDVADGQVFYRAQGAIKTTRGCEPEATVLAQPSNAVDLVVDPSFVYWIEQKPQRLCRVPRAGGRVERQDIPADYVYSVAVGKDRAFVSAARARSETQREALIFEFHLAGWKPGCVDENTSEAP